MSINSSSVTVTTSATVLASAGSDHDDVVITNIGATEIYVGPSGVTTSVGFPVAAGGSLSVKLPAGESIYGVVASGTEACRVLKVDA